jgi:hypothetical protein
MSQQVGPSRLSRGAILKLLGVRMLKRALQHNLAGWAHVGFIVDGARLTRTPSTLYGRTTAAT